MEELKWIIIIAGIILLCCIIFAVIQQYKFNKKLDTKIENYNKIFIGMSKKDAVNLLGNDFVVSFLKDGMEKYEWKIKIPGSNWGSSAKGVSVRHHKAGYTVSMTLKFKNGVVVEKKGNNLDAGSSSENAIVNYNKVSLGMTVGEVIGLLGNGYTISLLKNGTEKYEWKIREGGTSYRTSHHGFSAGSYSGGVTKKVTVVFKNNKVIEKKGDNLDL